MSSRYAFLLGAALSLGVAGSLAAQTGATTGTTIQDSSSSQAGTESTMSGTVVSSSGSWLVVRGTDGTERTFVVDNASTVPSSLTAGSEVSVRYQTLADGRSRAASVSSGANSSTPTSSTDATGSMGTTGTSTDSTGSSGAGSSTGAMGSASGSDSSSGSGTTGAGSGTYAPSGTGTSSTYGARRAVGTGADRLPATASSTPAFALVGLLLTVLGFALLRLSTRRAR